MLVKAAIACACALTAATAAIGASESNYTKARKIVYAVFPATTEAAALRVVACETGNTFNERSYNSSGASGYFQILRGNGGRVLYGPPTFNSRSKFKLTINKHLLFDPWYNTRVAYYLSKGGTDWGEWTCKP